MEAVKEAPLNRWILEYDTGLGKTATAITASKELGWNKILIVAPAIARGVWLRELSKWWPDHPTAASIMLGRTRKAGVSKKGAVRRDAAYAAPIQIVSYDLANGVDVSGWDAVIIDELHRLQSPQSLQSKTVRTVTEANTSAAVLGLTATLMPNEIIDVHNPLDTIWSERFGKRNKNNTGSWAFNYRYSNLHSNEYGKWFSGINQAHSDELRLRLGAISTRVTKQEVRHLLPILRVALLPVEPRSRAWYRHAAKLGATGTAAQLSHAGAEKVGHAVEWVENANHDGPVCVLTHLRETAEKIGERLSAYHSNVFVITGDDPPEERLKKIEYARVCPHAAIVATMHSVGISIDMSFCARVLFAELYYRPETMIQALGRFQRLNGTIDCFVEIMCILGTVDEVVAEILLQKFVAISSALQVGDNDRKLLEALTGPPISDTELFAQISDMLQTKAEDWLDL